MSDISFIQKALKFTRSEGNICRNTRLKICYILIALTGIYLIYAENIFANIHILRLLFNTNLALIPYLVICIIGYLVLFTGIFANISNKNSFIIAICVILVILAIATTFAGSYSVLDHTNDNDEALEQWLHALFSGNYPYEATTQLGNPITPFPFLPIYSIPYYFLGEVSIQNIVNVLVLICVFAVMCSDKQSFKFALVSLVISIPMWFLILTQSDHFTVAVLIMLGLVLLHKNKITIASIVFGCLIASKGYAWLVIPASLYWIFARFGYKKLLQSMAIYLLVSAIFILPFLLWKPHVFLTEAPFGAIEMRLTNILSIPYFTYIVSGIAIVLSLVVFHFTKKLSLSFLAPYILFTIFLFLNVALVICLLLVTIGLENWMNADYKYTEPQPI